MARIEALEKRLEEQSDSDEEAAKEAAKVYGVGNGVFAAAHRDEGTITPKEASEIAKKFKI